MTRDALRRQMRATRRALPPETRRLASIAAAVRLADSPRYRSARRIAVYVAMDGELDPTPFVMRARSDGRELYLPVLPQGEGPMSFLPYAQDAALTPNRFGIPEPAADPARVRPGTDMDLVLTPLVAFDLFGNRIGMGAGFYDRTFAFLKDTTRSQSPLIGYAYECQKVDAIDPQAWDVSLAGVATEQQFYAFSRT